MIGLMGRNMKTLLLIALGGALFAGNVSGAPVLAGEKIQVTEADVHYYIENLLLGNKDQNTKIDSG